MIGDGQRVAVASVAQHELALVVGAPELVRTAGPRTERAFGAGPRSAAAPLDQSMAIQHGVNGAAGRDLDCRQSSQQALADLAGAPVGFSRFVLRSPPPSARASCWRSDRAVGSIREPLQTAFLIALEDLVAGLAGNPELPAQCRHALASSRHKLRLVHNRTFLPWHPLPPLKGKSVTHVSGTFCYLCVGPLINNLATSPRPSLR